MQWGGPTNLHALIEPVELGSVLVSQLLQLLGGWAVVIQQGLASGGSLKKSGDEELSKGGVVVWAQCSQ